MKKILLLAVVSALFATSAMAAPKWSIVGAGDLSQVSASGLTDTTVPAGITLASKTKGSFAYGGGILMEVPLSPRVGFELGAVYLQRKYKITVTATDDATGTVLQTMEADQKHPFIQVPVMFKIHMGNVFTLGLGGYFANNVGQVTTTNADGTTEKNGYAEEELKRTDYGLSAGLGIALPMGSSAAFIIDGRYNMGLAEQFAPKADTTGSMKIKNNDITAFVGIRFGGK